MDTSTGMLAGVRVIEVADEQAEFAGKLLAGLGAEVVKVEPPEGARTRRYPPFFRERTTSAHLTEEPTGSESLYFWQYNTGKESVTLDLESDDGQAGFRHLVAGADVLLDSLGVGVLDRIGFPYGDLATLNPALVMVAVTPFGQAGPWRDWKGSDLVQLALGGVLMTTGYTEGPPGARNPPMAPQMWHASHIAGAHAAIATIAALMEVERSGVGHVIDVSLHRSVNYDTVSDLESWFFGRQAVRRQTAQYAAPVLIRNNLLRTRDGHYILNYLYQPRHYVALHQLLQSVGEHLDDSTVATGADGLADVPDVVTPEFCAAVDAAAERWIAGQDFRDELWQLAHRFRLNWAPVRSPAEALTDSHWAERGALVEIRHEDIDRTYVYPDQPWVASATPWSKGRRAPRLGEHNALLEEKRALLEEKRALLEEKRALLEEKRPGHRSGPGAPRVSSQPSDRVPALAGVRIVDLTWIVAGAGATRFLAAYGAETIKVEWQDNLDALRLQGTIIPVGDDVRAWRAGGANQAERVGPNQGAQFAEMNAGKLSVSLNMKTDEGKRLLLQLVSLSDVVVENLAPGVMERLGLDYDKLREANPSIIYAQMSGFGQTGPYSGFISTAPVAEAFSGISAQSGLPDPMPPAGWGYPYIDIASSYYLAMALFGALRHRRRTGQGQRIDCSLADTGLYLTGTALLDHQVNGKAPDRVGNRSVSRIAAPHGVYPCRGDDRWIAITAFDEAEWGALLRVLGHDHLARDPRFGSLADRHAHHDALDAEIAQMTRIWEVEALCTALQAAGVPAGTCQTARDRIEADTQLAFDGAQVDLPNPLVGSWPVRQLPWRSEGVGGRAGGPLGRGFPCYGEDNEYVLHHVLGLTSSEIEKLVEVGAIS